MYRRVDEIAKSDAGNTNLNLKNVDYCIIVLEQGLFRMLSMNSIQYNI